MVPLEALEIPSPLILDARTSITYAVNAVTGKITEGFRTKLVSIWPIAVCQHIDSMHHGHRIAIHNNHTHQYRMDIRLTQIAQHSATHMLQKNRQQQITTTN